MSKRLIFVDYNGVLSYDPFWKSLLDEKHELNSYLQDIEHYLFKENFHIVIDWMVGKYNSEEIHKIISDDLNLDYHLLLETFVRDCEQMVISDLILEKLKPLKKDFTLILATGNMDSFDRFTLPNHRYLFEIFDEIHNSYNLGLLKTSNNGEYFTRVSRKYNIDPNDTYLIDDSGSTCKTFSSFGGKAFKTKTETEVLDVLTFFYE
ncbi:hypothetical protein EBS02_03350 [bacterium]|nr:hypothetical protein [bacterium]